MMIRLGNGLWQTNLLSWLLILTILLFPESPVRIVLGITFILFFPGYALITALFPRKEGMSGIERVALSFGLSIALVVLIGLGLNYTPFGIRLASIMFSLAAVILILSVIAWTRGRRLPEADRFAISFRLSPASLWSGRPLDKALSIVLVVAILASLGAVAYTVAKPKPGEEFTEFYILGPGGKAADYPSEARVGEKAVVTGGIVNHFSAPATYRIAISVNGTPNGEVGPLVLLPKEKWEGDVGFTAQTVGVDQKVEFILSQTPAPEGTPQSLHLWVDVSE